MTDQHAEALLGFAAALDYCRAQLAGMSGEMPAPTARARQLVIARNCERDERDLTGSLAAVALRAAQLAANASTAAGVPLTVAGFLDGMERELTPPDDVSELD